jgi:Na+/melibiose symporter-like transporter
VIGLALQFSGFEPNIEQTIETQDTIRWLLALMPCGCYIVGAILLARFSFNETEHTAVRQALDQRATP